MNEGSQLNKEAGVSNEQGSQLNKESGVSIEQGNKGSQLNKGVKDLS